MSGIFWADTDYGLFVFVLLTVLGAAAAASRRARARQGLEPGLADRALYGGAVGRRALSAFLAVPGRALSIHYYLVTFVILLVVAWLGYKSMRATQMATQYSWAYEKVGLNWRSR